MIRKSEELLGSKLIPQPLLRSIQFSLYHKQPFSLPGNQFTFGGKTVRK